MPKTDPVSTAGKVIDQRQHADEIYTLIDNNEDFFRQSGEQIVRACKMQISVKVWTDNFRAAIEIIRQWAEQQSIRLKQILVEPRSDKMIFFAIPKSDQFDFDLAFAQAELDVKLNTQCNIGYAETRQVPSWELNAFVSSEAKEVWATSDSTVSQGESVEHAELPSNGQ